MERSTPHTPQWKLRRFAPRALRVHERHQGKEPGLAGFASSLVPSALGLIDTYDAVRQYTSTRLDERVQSRHALDALVRKVRVWVPQVARDIRAVAIGEFGDTDVPDDVIGDAKSLIEHVTGHVNAGNDPLPYQDELIADLGPALDVAQAEWTQAESAQDQYIALRDAARQAAARFETDLVAFRRALRAVIGSSHADYQKLRSERARTPDADDDAVAAELPVDEPEDVLPTDPPEPNDAPREEVEVPAAE